MPRFTFRHRLVPLFVTVLLLVAPWSAQALPLDRADPLTGGVARLIAWISTMFGDYGCSADPSGTCRGLSTPPAPPDQVDVGCSLDPDGRCHGSTTPDQLDVGCSLDPNGRCGDHN